jgi:hypothetical protein
MSLTLRAFLSHRYESPIVNTYFYEIFAEAAELQFDVDRAKGATNVTRLERMIRDTDAFVGIYPFEPTEGDSRPSRQALVEASQYFRLELDLAARARTPGIVFIDRRYGPVLTPHPSMFVCTFDDQEIRSAGGSPNRPLFKSAFERFCENVDASMQYERTRPQTGQASAVALLLPPDPYGAEEVERLTAAVVSRNLDVERLDWPPRLDGRLLGRLQSFDWVVTEVGERGAPGMVAFLHGQGIPTLRLAWRQGVDVGAATPEAASPLSPLEESLYGAYEVGYRKDIVRWTTGEELEQQIDRRLTRILQESRRIGAVADARAYFQDAARRKETVFLSYSGQDQDRVAPIADALRRRFQSVFDYRDGGDSIEPGKPWMAEIFEKLERSGVGVLMLSQTYLQSGNCAHEARSLMAARDGGKIRIIPVKLGQEALDPPPWLTDIQYLRAWEHPSPEAIVDRIVKSLA